MKSDKVITKKTVDALIADAKARGETVFLWDAELKGFGVKASATACSYVMQYRLGGRGAQTKRVTLGKHGTLTPEQARKAAKEKLGEVAKGVDVAEQRKEKREKLAGLTFAEAVEKFLSIHDQGTRYWKLKAARLASDDVKALLNKPLSTISRKHVADAIDRAKARSKAAERHLFSDLRPFFKWAHRRGHVDINPMADEDAPKPLKARDRVLEDHEIKAFWQAASDAAWPYATIYKLLLLTGARREEVAGMKWSELDLDAGVWMLPGKRTKNGRDHRIPLSPQAIALLDRLGIAAIKAGRGYEDGDLVFSTSAATAPSCFSWAKRALDDRMKAILGARFKDWRIHDLRRTCASGMESSASICASSKPR